MSTTTTRLGLYKPASDGSELVNVVTDLNNNYDAIDLAMGFRIVTSSTRPSSPYGGQGIEESDTGRFYLHNGSSPASGGWIEIPNGTATYGSQLWASRATDATTFRAANTLTTATSPIILGESAAASGNAYGARVAGDTQDRLRIRADGRIDIGPGTGARDTNLYRSAADTLKTDDSFVVGSTLAVTGAATIGSTLTVISGLTVGGNLTVAGIGQVLTARKTGDTARTNNTLADDPHLTVTADANAIYEISGCFFFNGLAAADFREQFTVPSGASYRMSMLGQDQSATVTVGTVITDQQTGAQTWGTIGTSANMTCQFKGILKTGGTGGAVTVQWAQASTNATATTLVTDSYFVLRRIA